MKYFNEVQVDSWFKNGEYVGHVTLVLPTEAARTLATVCDLIGGEPTTSRRGHMDRINDALREIFKANNIKKLPYSEGSFHAKCIDRKRGDSIYFLDEE